MITPGYIDLYHSGILKKRVELFSKYYSECTLCPNQCKVNRTKSERGLCRSGSIAVIASYNAHFGEEPPISGKYGSGTIFFSGCTGKCLFCQNYPISQLNTGEEKSDLQLAEIMLSLQSRGCHNINFVTPTHFLPSIIVSLYLAVKGGLHIPLVYNTSGYDKVEVIKLLDGIVDIYLPDAKYSDDVVANDISSFSCYTKNNHDVIAEMYKQAGNLITDDGIALKGLIIRHLVLPENLSGTGDVLSFISKEISDKVHVSLMNQYFPAYKALYNEKLSRHITHDEYDQAVELLFENGLTNGWVQEFYDS